MYQKDLDPVVPSKQLTFFDQHPVRFLTISNQDQLCFSFHGEIFTLQPGQEPVKVTIDISSDVRFNPEKIITINKDITEFDLSPNKKEVVFISRGEVFVASIEGGTTKRVTSTPEQERSVSFSPDGRSILYASERDNSWNIYQSTLSRKEEKYFFNATIIEEAPIVKNDKETFQPAYAPMEKKWLI